MIDLHTHTTESDGTMSPTEIVRTAIQAGLEALAITDHDTFSGYDQALPFARESGFDLVCGIELSTKFHDGHSGKTVHLLGYFLKGTPQAYFRDWLSGMQKKRRERNTKMAARLQELGLDVTLQEAEQLGRSITGRPHFARLLVKKGYVPNLEEAFNIYLGESGRAYIDRDEPPLAEAIQRVHEAGGITSLPHPKRTGVESMAGMERLIAAMRDMGLSAVEAYNTEHTEDETQGLLQIASRYEMTVTGGSDFHGDNRPGVSLGTGLNGSLRVPRRVLDVLRNGSSTHNSMAG